MVAIVLPDVDSLGITQVLRLDRFGPRANGFVICCDEGFDCLLIVVNAKDYDPVGDGEVVSHLVLVDE